MLQSKGQSRLVIIINQIKQDKLGYSFLFLQLYYFSGVSSFINTDESLVLNLLLTVTYAAIKKTQLKYFGKIVKVILGFLLLQGFTAIFFNNFNIIVTGGFVIRLAVAYFIIEIFKIRFFDYLLNLLVVLSAISIPFYIIQVLEPRLFQYFQPISFVTPRREIAGHINIFVYHYNSWGPFRNSGFMWEPAAFGAILALGLIISLLKSKFKIGSIEILLVFTMITTFSIGTYIYLLMLLLWTTMNNTLKSSVGLIVLFASIIFFVTGSVFFQENFDSMVSKLESYEESTSLDQAESIKAHKMSRTQGFLADFHALSKWWLGYGIAARDDETFEIYSSNSFSSYSLKFGVIGILFLLISINYYRKTLEEIYRIRPKLIFVIPLVIILTMNGNPFDRAPFFLVIMLYGYISWPISERIQVAKNS